MEKRKNLITMAMRSEEERKQLASKGGKRSGEVRRMRRELADILIQMINHPLPKDNRQAREALRKMGISPDEATFGASINLQLINLALNRKADHNTNLRAIEAIYKHVEGEKIDITSGGKELSREPLVIEVIDRREQVAEKADEG